MTVPLAFPLMSSPLSSPRPYWPRSRRNVDCASVALLMPSTRASRESWTTGPPPLMAHGPGSWGFLSLQIWSRSYPNISKTLVDPPRRAERMAISTRHWVILFAVTLAVITYIDRVCISKAAPLIQADMGLTKEQMGYIFSAFTLAYALFEIPGGWLGDKLGPRRVLT